MPKKKTEKTAETNCEHPDLSIEWDGEGPYLDAEAPYYKGTCEECGETVVEQFERTGLFTESGQFIRE